MGIAEKSDDILLPRAVLVVPSPREANATEATLDDRTQKAPTTPM